MGNLCSRNSDEAVVDANHRSGDNRAIEVGKMSMKGRLAARDALEAKRREKVVKELNEAKFISYNEENVAPPPAGVQVIPLDHPTSANNDVRSQDFSQAPPSGLLEPLPSESEVYPLPFELEAKIEEEEKEEGTKIFNPTQRAQPSESPSPPEPCESVGDQTTLDAERENASPPTVCVISEKSASPSCDLPDGVVIACVPPPIDAEEGGNSRRDGEKQGNTPADVLPSASSSPRFSSAPPEDVDAPSAEMAVLLREKTTLGSSLTGSCSPSAAEFSENAAPVVEKPREASMTNTEKKVEEERMSEEKEREHTKEQDAGETVVEAPPSPEEASESQEERVNSPAALHWDPQGTRESTPKANHRDEEEEAVKSEEREEEDSTPQQEAIEVAADEQEGSEGIERDEKEEKHSGVVPSTAAEEEVRPSSADDLDRQASSLISLPEEAEEDDEEFPFSPPFAPAETGEAEEVHRQDWEGSHPEEEVVSREDSEAPEPAPYEDLPSPLLDQEEATEERDDFRLEGETEGNEAHFATPQDESVSREEERSPSPASVTPPEAPLEALPGDAPHFRGPVLPPSPSPASEAAAGPGPFSFRDQWNGDNDESRGEEAPQKYRLAPPSVEPPIPRRQPPLPPSLSSDDE